MESNVLPIVFKIVKQGNDDINFKKKVKKRYQNTLGFKLHYFSRGNNDVIFFHSKHEKVYQNELKA